MTCCLLKDEEKKDETMNKKFPSVYCRVCMYISVQVHEYVLCGWKESSNSSSIIRQKRETLTYLNASVEFYTCTKRRDTRNKLFSFSKVCMHACMQLCMHTSTSTLMRYIQFSFNQYSNYSIYLSLLASASCYTQNFVVFACACIYLCMHVCTYLWKREDNYTTLIKCASCIVHSRDIAK